MKLIISAVILGIFSGILFNLKSDKKLDKKINFDSYLWPKGSEYKIDKEGDIILIINEEFHSYGGIWPRGTEYYFNEDKLNIIKVPSKKFSFLEFKFNGPGVIKKISDKNYLLNLTKDHHIDGVLIDQGCELNFIDSILKKAACTDGRNLKFKRSIDFSKLDKGKI